MTLESLLSITCVVQWKAFWFNIGLEAPISERQAFAPEESRKVGLGSERRGLQNSLAHCVLEGWVGNSVQPLRPAKELLAWTVTSCKNEPGPLKSVYNL